MRFDICFLLLSSAVLTQGWPIVDHNAISQEELAVERASREQDCQAGCVVLRSGLAGQQGQQVNILGFQDATSDKSQASYKTLAYLNNNCLSSASCNGLSRFGIRIDSAQLLPFLQDSLFWCAAMFALVASMIAVSTRWTPVAKHATEAAQMCDTPLAGKEFDAATACDEYDSVLVWFLDLIEGISS